MSSHWVPRFPLHLCFNVSIAAVPFTRSTTCRCGFHHHTMKPGWTRWTSLRSTMKLHFEPQVVLQKKFCCTTWWLHTVVRSPAAFSGDYFLYSIAWWVVTQDELICSIHHHQRPTNHKPLTTQPTTTKRYHFWVSLAACHAFNLKLLKTPHPGCQSPSRMTWHVF